MSLISNRHTATVYAAKTSKPFDGQRLVVTTAKKDKDGNYGQHLQQTMCTSIPVLTRADIDWQLSSIQDAASEYFKSVQNAIIADRLKSGQKDVTDQDITMTSIIDYINAESTGDKWDSARVATWFNEVIAEHIGVALIERGFPDDKVDASLKAYEKLISETFSSRSVIPRKKAEAINKAFKLVEKSDATMARFQARIDKVLIEENMDELLGL